MAEGFREPQRDGRVNLYLPFGRRIGKPASPGYELSAICA